jgi:hypothetical protein
MSRQKNSVRIGQLILVPALISLGVTLLRLTGELQSWSDTWFSKATGGAMPSGVSWVIGITWLALPFGAYFAWRLHAVGEGPARPGRAFLLALAGTALFYGGLRLVIPLVQLRFPTILLVIWSVALAAAVVAWTGWPVLARVLAAYGLSARIPVAAVMALAMLGGWGTHYDYVDMPPQFQMPFWPRFLWLAFVPQLVFWVGYTIIIGLLAGTATALAIRMARR